MRQSHTWSEASSGLGQCQPAPHAMLCLVIGGQVRYSPFCLECNHALQDLDSILRFMPKHSPGDNTSSPGQGYPRHYKDKGIAGKQTKRSKTTYKMKQNKLSIALGIHS